MYYAFCVLGWNNEQTTVANSETEAWDTILKMTTENEVRGFRQISLKEYIRIKHSWYKK